MKKLFILLLLASLFAPALASAEQPAQNPNLPSASTPLNQLPSQQQTDDLGCSFANATGNGSTSAGMGVAICTSSFVYWIMVGLGSWIANIAAYVFDYAVQFSLQSGAYALDFINVGWTVVRDVANMSFLFILIYIAFKIMFQAETAGTMRMLVWVIIIALMVNFSFVMTRIVIDAGNIVAIQFYTAVSANAPSIQQSAQISGSNVTQGTNTPDITTSFMSALNPQALLGGSKNFKDFVSNNQSSPMYYLIVTSIVFILTGVALYMLAVTLFFTAIKFLVRVVGLWFVIIAAPAAFVAAIFRGKEGGSKWFARWLGFLLQFTFYPAVFLFMFYIQVRFMLEISNAQLFNTILTPASTGNTQSWADIAQGAANVTMRLGLILTTMYLTLKGADWTMGEVSSWTGTVQGKLTGFGRTALRYGSGGLLTGSAYVGRGLQRGVQAQSNVATRTGVNSTLWRGLNRITGGTNIPTPRNQTLSGVLLNQSNKRGVRGLFAQREEEKQKRAEKAGADERGRIEPKAPDYTGQAPEPRVSLPGSRGAENLPAGPRRIEPRIPTGPAPEVKLGVPVNAQGVINAVRASSQARGTQASGTQAPASGTQPQPAPATQPQPAAASASATAPTAPIPTAATSTTPASAPASATPVAAAPAVASAPVNTSGSTTTGTARSAVTTPTANPIGSTKGTIDTSGAATLGKLIQEMKQEREQKSTPHSAPTITINQSTPHVEAKADISDEKVARLGKKLAKYVNDNGHSPGSGPTAPGAAMPTHGNDNGGHNDNNPPPAAPAQVIPKAA